MTKEEIEAFVSETVANHPGNRQEDGEPYFEAPIFGYADGGDSIFSDFKSLIGDFHRTPSEVFAEIHGEAPKRSTVVVWSLPAAAATLKDQRQEDRHPSRRWSRTRDFGQQFINELGRLTVEWLKPNNIRAVAPSITDTFKMWPHEKLGWTSNWSERHAAYAAGLGTFSLNDALITKRGIAHRLGSMVVELDLEPLQRNKNYRGNCLFAVKGTCGACIKRCPAGALSEDGHDKDKCCAYCYVTLPPLIADLYGVGNKVTGCGLCQTKVPCEAGIPKGIGD